MNPGRGFALVLRPEEAGVLVQGWPARAWLVVTRRGGGPRWEAARERDLPQAVGGLPVWPPLGGFERAEVAAEDEIALLRHLAALPGLAEAAREEDHAPASAPPPRACDLDWDE